VTALGVRRFHSGRSKGTVGVGGPVTPRMRSLVKKSSVAVVATRLRTVKEPVVLRRGLPLPPIWRGSAAIRSGTKRRLPDEPAPA
jgi:hypothetical protein